MIYECPHCRLELKKSTLPDRKIYWVCKKCSGKLIGIRVLESLTRAGFCQRLWQGARSAPKGQVCPSCAQPSRQVLCLPQAQDLELDVCLRCHMVWLDPGDFKSLPLAPESPPAQTLPPEASARLVELRLEEFKKQQPKTVLGPDEHEFWHYLPGLLGLPLEENPDKLKGYPILTRLLVLLTKLISLYALWHLPEVVARYAFVPSDPLRHSMVTLLSYFFVHGGFFHLLGNMYFLWVFGDNVEEYLGIEKYFFLLLVSTLSCCFLTWIFIPESSIPHIGASGGVFGVMTFYLLQFRHARIRYLFVFFFRLYSWRLSPFWALAALMIFQLIGAAMDLNGFPTGVAHLGHLGGALGGLLLWILWGRRDS